MFSLNKLAEWGIGILVTLLLVAGWMLLIHIVESTFKFLGW